jgi:hypothetical protein
MHLIVLDNQLSILICWYHLQKKTKFQTQNLL